MQPGPLHDDAAPLGGLWLGAGRPLATRVLPPLLIVACVAADLAVYAWHPPRSNFPTVSGMAYLALAFSQISLATIWASLARVEQLFHWMAAGSAISLLLLALMRFEPAGEAWFLLIGLQILALAIPLRMSGASLTWQAVACRAARKEMLRMQFSLRHAFLVLSGSAILLGLLRAVDFSVREMVLFYSFGLLFAAIGWVSVWAVFGRGPGVCRLLALWTFGPCAGGLIAWMTIRGNESHFALFHALLNLLQSLLLGGALLVLRIAGYRLYSSTGSEVEPQEAAEESTTEPRRHGEERNDATG